MLKASICLLILCSLSILLWVYYDAKLDKTVLMASIPVLFKQSFNLNSLVDVEIPSVGPKAAIHSCNPIIPNAQIEFFSIDNVTYPKFIPKFLNKSYNFTCLNQDKTAKLILQWPIKANYSISRRSFNNCPVDNCQFSNNPELVNESSIIFFDVLFLYGKSLDALPKWRKPDQKWVLVSIESQQRFNTGTAD